MKSLAMMMQQADFSKETDLKARLYNRLFSANAVAFPGSRKMLNEDELEMVNAAGEFTANEKEKKF